MAEEISPEIIQSTQKLLGKHVTKPQLTEKLLRKPPFRFLHDVINALVRDTGFLKGLFTENELNSENVKDREAKIAFLNKLITAIKTISGKTLPVRASKIIAGLDATETNRLLQTIGKCIDDKVDTKAYVKDLKKNTNDAKDGGAIKKITTKTSLSKVSTEKLESTRKTGNEKRLKKNIEDTTPKATNKVDSKKKLIKVDKVSSKTSMGSKESKISKGISKADSKKGIKVSPKWANSNASTPKNDAKSPRGQAMSSKETDQPEKEESPRAIAELDSRRPQIMEESFAPQKLKQSEVGEVLDEVKSPKLQQEVNDISIGKDDKEVDKSEVVKENEITSIRQPSARPKSARPRSGNVDGAQRPPLQIQKSHEKNYENAAKDFSSKGIREIKEYADQAPDSNTNPDIETKKPPSFRPKSSMLRPPSVRPSSARPGAPRLRAESSLPMKEVVPLGKINVIVENFDSAEGTKDDDEEETVVIESVPDEMRPEASVFEKRLNIPVDKGHLVEQILEQIQGPDGGAIDDVKGQLEWENESMRGKDATAKEINALRSSIQSLTRTANPLGKLTSYLHEDIEAMHSELETWLNMKKQFTVEITKQKKLNTESNQPLITQQRNLEENIKKERDEIASVKYNILKNEERIRQLVGKQITMD